ncbi:hypothetical protein [Yinghuangia seranimata]|nr:hypothetical protein [Yinghuangia seranimata]MDI2131857.1 hypothetical protein [Yinghuangia seranimata]
MIEYQLFQTRSHEMREVAAHERVVSTALRTRRAARRARREARTTHPAA